MGLNCSCCKRPVRALGCCRRPQKGDTSASAGASQGSLAPARLPWGQLCRGIRGKAFGLWTKGQKVRERTFAVRGVGKAFYVAGKWTVKASGTPKTSARGSRRGPGAGLHKAAFEPAFGLASFQCKEGLGCEPCWPGEKGGARTVIARATATVLAGPVACCQ